MRSRMITTVVHCVLLLFNAEAAKHLCIDFTTNSRRFIDDTVYKCVSGIPVKITPTPQSLETLTVPPQQTHGQCRMSLERYEGGHKCCGFLIYHPDFTTCCFQSSTKSAVHQGKKEKQHVCCDLQAYGRYEAPCRRNPGNNDKLWHSKRLARKVPRLRVCDLYQYAFSIEILSKAELFYNVTVEMISGIGRNDPKYVRQMQLPIDKYSPKKNIVGNTFLHFTNSNGLDPKQNFLDWFIGKNDYIFKVSKRQENKLAKIVRNMFKPCRRIRH